MAKADKATSKMTIYHNPRCGKSRTALQLLKASGVEPEVIPYLEEPPTATRLRELLKLLGLKAIEVVRRNETVAKELGIGRKDYSDAELIDLMVRHPILIERPIVVKGKKAVVARPPERVHEII
jgi:arsenate reductase